jgi:hypothetical protein
LLVVLGVVVLGVVVLGVVVLGFLAGVSPSRHTARKPSPAST